MFIAKASSRRACVLALTVLILVAFHAGTASAQTTAFTYQGRLTDAGSPATGQYDLEFRVFDAAVLGTQLAVLQLDNVQVTGGVFTSRLDYGGITPTLFNGAARYMEIGVRPGASSGAYTTLTPRQEVTSTPYAIQAANIQQTSGNSVVTALNDAATTTPISASKLDPNLVRFNPAAPQVSVGDANGTAAMVSLRGGSTCCSGPGGYTPADFKVFQNGSFVATGNLGIGTIPFTGKGYRTMWYTYKGAFRSGYADNEWDDANTGFFSWAGGSNSTASGLYSFSFGDTNFASSTSSIAFGSGNEVKGAAGFSAGAGNRVCDTYGVAFGNKAISGGPLVNGKCDTDTFNITGLAAVAIGYNVTADKDHSTAMGKFASNNGFSGVFIWSDGSATASADTFKSTANNEFAARATGGFRFRTNLTGTTGCNLPAGSGVFNCTSSKTLKENFAGVGGEDLLARVRKIPVNTWNYIAEGKQVRHIGPFAEDFYGAFHLGTDDKSIGVLDIAGVNFAANKALELRTAELQRKVIEVDQLRTEVNALRAANTAMELRLAAIERAVRKQGPSGRARAAIRRAR
jgi:hypothetical protein